MQPCSRYSVAFLFICYVQIKFYFLYYINRPTVYVLPDFHYVHTFINAWNYAYHERIINYMKYPLNEQGQVPKYLVHVLRSVGCQCSERKGYILKGFDNILPKKFHQKYKIPSNNDLIRLSVDLSERSSIETYQGVQKWLGKKDAWQGVTL